MRSEEARETGTDDRSVGRIVRPVEDARAIESICCLRAVYVREGRAAAADAIFLVLCLQEASDALPRGDCSQSRSPLDRDNQEAKRSKPEAEHGHAEA